MYTVHDVAGHEVRVHVDKTTHLEGGFKTGDKVEAYVTDRGHARSLHHIKQTQPAPSVAGYHGTLSPLLGTDTLSDAQAEKRPRHSVTDWPRCAPVGH